MAKINQHYRQLKDSYLFSDIARRVAAFSQAHPEKEIIRMGIGDVTLPLMPSVISSLHSAVEEMADASTFRGYGPEQGYGFLRDAIRAYYVRFGVQLDPDEIFVSDGAKSDLGNITDLFSADNTVLIPDPVYPVYVDTNLMNGRKILYMNANAENGFLPMPDPEVRADLIYLCSPNNPTGAVYTREQLAAWIDYALAQDAVLLFDAAYEAFIGDSSLPHSIFELPDAKRCAIEFCSLSKTAGFTGTRCGYTIIPKTLKIEGMSPNRMWNRRQATKFNGVPYIIQRGAEAAFSEEGVRQSQEMIAYYKKNTAVMAETLERCGVHFFGGVHSPYLWMECPDRMDSWTFFDYLLENAAIVGTPGAGFGINGEGYFRLTGFGSQPKTMEAMQRISSLLKGAN
ncbi:LL-diaminopimelate aminotransferase [Anaerotruncus sp. 1XD42-93]|uniref:LL-diaminopimelate aminotransferase n=1 Tax=Anaerotruncus sp. 1XD42-93 TaxID=2320853 RepID=UPI000EA06C23|nr:LL-diaminopimelate aminotransferase [Anaerotruncus sp. 1XD42-93]NBK17786.1 LL-diaminopimelate aminotransferase [Anaerotruncus sp. 1XD42-93]RKJ94418.1 LL-diaminopimelate aminotransferase [Anaerotruncus sp. 1XD22-93]